MWISHRPLNLLELNIVRFQALKLFFFFYLILRQNDCLFDILEKYHQILSDQIVIILLIGYVFNIFGAHSPWRSALRDIQRCGHVDIGKTESIWCITLTAAYLHPLATNIISVFSINGTQFFFLLRCIRTIFLGST